MTEAEYRAHQIKIGRELAMQDVEYAKELTTEPVERSGTILLPYPVSTNRAYRNFRGRTVMSAEGRAYKIAVAAAMAGQVCHAGSVIFSYWLHPRTTAKGCASRVRIDLDNTKLLLDALNGVAWRDDSQIVELHGYVAEPVHGGGVSVLVQNRLSLTTT